MEFSCTIFYRLRDIAAIVNKGRTQLRFSKSALELTYEYHLKQEILTSSLDRWFSVVFALVFAGVAWYHGGILLGGIVAVVAVPLFALGRSVKRLAPYGVVRVTYIAGQSFFQFETIEPAGASPPSLGAELSLSSIQSFRVRTISDYSDADPVYGLVEVRHTASVDWHLFAELPTPGAAWQLEEALTNLTESFSNATVVKESKTWSSKAIRAIALFYLRLRYVKTRPK